MPSYLRDTTDFLNKLYNVVKVAENDLRTMDVTSLYTNIPHDLGLGALDPYLKTRAIDEPPTKLLWNLANKVLTINYFKFKDTFLLSN